MKNILVTGAHGTLVHVVMLDDLCNDLEDEKQSRPGQDAVRWAAGASA